MKQFLSLPLIDVVQKHVPAEKRASFPTAVITGSSEASANSKEKQRIDYILVSPFFEQKCIYAEVINYGDTEYLSDHFPVIAAFEWKE